jgi:hypothetical protein
MAIAAMRIARNRKMCFRNCTKLAAFAAENFFSFLGLSFVVVFVTRLATAFNAALYEAR